jgi:hypothetical protein
MDELIGVASGLSGSEQGGPTAESPLNIVVDLTAPGGELGGYEFQRLSSTIRIASDDVLLQPLRLGMFGGEYDGHLRVAPHGGTPEIVLNGRSSGMNVATILQKTRKSSSMSGTLGGSFSVSSRGTSASQILRAAHGSGRMTIVNGVIPGLEMVRAVVLAFGKPSGAPPAGSGSAFSRIEGTFSLADQTLRSDDLRFTSRDFDMSGTAVVRLPSGGLDVRADVVLSRELTAQAGTDLRRYAQDDGRVELPAPLTGTMAEPSVSLNVPAALNRALQNEIKRRVKGWLDRIK